MSTEVQEEVANVVPVFDPSDQCKAFVVESINGSFSLERDGVEAFHFESGEEMMDWVNAMIAAYKGKEER